jgi:YVTN family beta-propeller protein
MMNMKHTFLAALVASFGAATLTGCPTPGASQNPGQTNAQTGAQAAADAPTLQASKQITVGASPHGMALAGGYVYNANQGAASISVIDPATDAVIKEVAVPNGSPGYTKAFHDGKHVLVIDSKQGNLLVLDPAKDHAIVQTIAVGKGPDKIAIDEDDKSVLVSLTDESKAILFTFDADRAKAPARQELAVGSVAPAQFKHRAIAFMHGWAVVPNSGENNTHLLNPGASTVASAGTPAQTVTGGNTPGPVGIGTVSDQAVVALVGNVASNTITLFNLPTFEATTLSNVGLSPNDVIVDAQLKRAFVTMAGSNELTAIDYVGKAVVGRAPTGKRPVHIAMAPVMPQTARYSVQNDSRAQLSHEIWVGNDDGESVTVVDGETMRVKATVMTGKGHHIIAFAGTKAYVSNLTDNTVSVIDRTAIK